MYGAILQGIGAGTSALGGVASTIGNRISSNKARKNRLNGLAQAKNEFTLGSQDTQGNQYNFNNQRGWGYDLSNSGKAEATNANRQSYLANAMSTKLPSSYRKQLTAADYLSAQRQANANQSAANRTALRTGSNLGDISRSYARMGSDNLRQAMAQNMHNGQTAQASAINNYLTNAQNAKALTQSTMQNLQNQQAGAATQQLLLNEAIAEANAVPRINGLQTGGQIAQGLGQGIAQLGKGMSMTNMLQGLGGNMQTSNTNLAQNMQNSGVDMSQLLKVLLSMYGGQG